MRDKAYAVVMAGGRGERFWPLSDATLPKPFLPLMGKSTMIQATLERIRGVIPLERILIVLSREHLSVARQQLPEVPSENFLVEPFGRDTAACIGFASLYIRERDSAGAMVVLAADHLINDEEGFGKTIINALQFVELHDTLVTIGVKPARPETGYGYIERGLTIDCINGAPFYRVKRFVEKPDVEVASRFLTSGNYYWNSGMFVWRNLTIQRSLSIYMPELWQGLIRIGERLGTDEEEAVIKEEFSRFKRVSIDYGVLEKSSEVVVTPAGFDWDDVGTWDALGRVRKCDTRGNVVVGRHVGKETDGCVIYVQDQLLATWGIRDLVIVQAKGKILVCHKDKAPYLKELITIIPEHEVQ